MGSGYSASKTMAEKRAWELAKETGISLTTIHPALVIGPVLPQQSAASTVGRVLQICDGTLKERGIPQMAFGLVDTLTV